MKKFAISIFISLVLIGCGTTGSKVIETPVTERLADVSSKSTAVEEKAGIEAREKPAFLDTIPDDALMLFVQVGESGRFLKTKDGYRLTLNNVAPKVIYFSDRPYHIVGHMTISEWAFGMWEDKSVNFKGNPPNAVLTIFDESHEADEIAVELHDAEYNAEEGTMHYYVRVLGDYLEELEGQERQKYAGIPEEFGNASLFIDSTRKERKAARKEKREDRRAKRKEKWKEFTIIAAIARVPSVMSATIAGHT